MNTEKLVISSNTLPLKHSLKGDYLLMVLITFLVAIASISGLLANRILYPIEELRHGFVTTDILNLLFVLLLISKKKS